MPLSVAYIWLSVYLVGAIITIIKVKLKHRFMAKASLVGAPFDGWVEYDGRPMWVNIVKELRRLKFTRYEFLDIGFSLDGIYVEPQVAEAVKLYLSSPYLESLTLAEFVSKTCGKKFKFNWKRQWKIIKSQIGLQKT